MVLGDDLDDPRCPECGGPIGPTATTCLHCSADLVGKDPIAPEEIPSGEAGEGSEFMNVSTASSTPVEHPLDPDGAVDNTLTIIVGILGGLVIGVIGSFVLLFLVESVWAIPFGLAAWLGSTAYLVRRRFLLDAVSKGAYGVALVLLLVPILAVTLDGGIMERGGIFVVLLIVAVLPAGVAAGIGWFASRYVPENAG